MGFKAFILVLIASAGIQSGPSIFSFFTCLIIFKFPHYQTTTCPNLSLAGWILGNVCGKVSIPTLIASAKILSGPAAFPPVKL